MSAIEAERAASQNPENLQNNVENDDDLISEANFENYEKLVSHYEKHGAEFKCYDSVEKYLEGARYVMKTGYKVEYPYKQEVRTGYVKFLSNNHKGNAKFAFVGTNNKGFITTFHTESGKTFWKMLNGENIQIINCK